MHYTNVYVIECKTVTQCRSAAEVIEANYINYDCSWFDWKNGERCEMYKGAQRKVDALLRKADKLADKLCEEIGE